MLVWLAVGEIVYQAHRFRRTLILSPLFAMGTAIVVMVIRNWRHIGQFFAMG